MKKRTFLLIALFSSYVLLIQSCTKPEISNDAAVSPNEADRNPVTFPNGTFKISNISNAANVIALVTQSVDDGIKVKLKNYISDSTSHVWHFTTIGDGFYRISNAYSGKVLAAPSAIEGQQLVQQRYDTSDNQLWRIRTAGTNCFQFLNKATGFYINKENNGTITQRALVNSQNELWQLSKVKVIYVDVDATNFFRRTEGWIASDGDVSIPLTDGRVMWTSGDAHIDDYDYATEKIYCLFQVRNAGLIQPATHSWYWPQTGTLVGNPFPGFESYFKNKASDDYWMWPGCGFQVTGNDTIYVYNSPLKKRTDGGWGWDEDGNPLWGKVRSSDMKVVQYSELQDYDDIDFGKGFAVENDGYVYAFGTRQTFITANVYVARFPVSNPNAKWSFWTGTGWSKNVKDVKRITEGATNSTTVAKVRNKYVVLSTEFSLGCDGGTHIYASVGDSPTGPFTWRKEIYEIPDRLEGHVPFWYGAYSHDEFTTSANELLITYAIGGYDDCVNTCKGGRVDPDIARPRAIRIPLSLVDASFN